MIKRINRNLYLRLLRELRDLARQYHCEIEIRRRPINWNLKNFGSVAGEFRAVPKRLIVINAYGRPARRKLLAIIAHEVRHAMHFEEGFYPSYYRTANYTIINDLRDNAMKIPKGFVLPDLDEAVAAERDCNAWAEAYMKERGVDVSLGEYSFEDTGAYGIHCYIINRVPGQYIKNPGAALHRLQVYSVHPDSLRFLVSVKASDKKFSNLANKYLR